MSYLIFINESPTETLYLFAWDFATGRQPMVATLAPHHAVYVFGDRDAIVNTTWTVGKNPTPSNVYEAVIVNGEDICWTYGASGVGRRSMPPAAAAAGGPHALVQACTAGRWVMSACSVRLHVQVGSGRSVQISTCPIAPPPASRPSSSDPFGGPPVRIMSHVCGPHPSGGMMCTMHYTIGP